MTKTVLVTGVFDLLHMGHVSLLSEASAMGELVVGVESDIRVAKTKGSHRPYWNQDKRLAQLQALDLPLKTMVLPETMADPEVRRQLLTEINPSVLVTSDSSPHLDNKAQMMEALGGKVVTVPQLFSLSTSLLATNLESHPGMEGYHLVSPLFLDLDQALDAQSPVILGRYLGFQKDTLVIAELTPGGLKVLSPGLINLGSDQPLELVWLLSPLGTQPVGLNSNSVTHVHNYLQGLRLQS